MPRRPSGADKEEKLAKKQGGHGRNGKRRGDVSRSTPNSVLFAANQHCQTLNLFDARSDAKPVSTFADRARSAMILGQNH
jgi:hypothetical protein